MTGAALSHAATLTGYAHRLLICAAIRLEDVGVEAECLPEIIETVGALSEEMIRAADAVGHEEVARRAARQEAA